MATLLKLHVSGIRSFGPFEDQAQQLKFATPVTLILGQNGCGKTTIIESIRYACTGELPLNSSNGQAFVNDPKMSESSSTKGQVKLKFRDPLGNDVTISRIVEVIQMAASLKFTSKSMTIRYVKPDGTQADISGRCQDITKVCCQRLNVSSSVLNNVVFCHQENSCWPLEEAKKVKERFDEIFDAAKYNTCTDKMKKLIKEKENNMKLMKVQLSHRNERKEAVEKDKRKLQAKQEQLAAFNDQIAAKESDREPIRKRLEEICELENELGTLQRKLAGKEEAKRGMIEQQDTIRRNITKEFVGTDEELQREIDSSEANRAKDEQQIFELEKKKCEVEAKITEHSTSIQNIQKKLGELNQEKVQYERKVKHREELLQKAKTLMDVTIHEDPNVSMSNLKTALNTAEKQLKEKIQEVESEDRKLQEKVDEAREKQVRTKQTILTKQTELKDSRTKINEISNELNKLNTSDYLLKEITTKMEQLDKDVMNLKKNFSEAEEDQKIYEFKKDIQGKERLLENLERDFKILQQNDVTEGKIENERHSIQMKEQEISKILFHHSEELGELFGENVPQANIQNALTNLHNRENAKVRSLTESITKLERELTRLEAERKNQVEKITNCEQDLDRKQVKIREVCNGKSFEETIKSVHVLKEELQRDKGYYNSFVVIYEEFVNKFQKDSPCCPVCETDFTQRNDAVRQIISTIRTKIQKIPKKLATTEEKLKTVEETYNKLEQLRLTNDEIKVLSNEKLPLLKQQLFDIDNRLKQKSEELKKLTVEREEPQKKVDISTQIASYVASLDHHRTDIERSQKTVAYLKEQIVQVSSQKSKQAVEEEIESNKSEIAELRRKIDIQQKKVNKHKDRAQQLAVEKSQLLTKHLSLKESIQNKPLLETQKSELMEKMTTLSDDLKTLRTDLANIEQELKDVIRAKEDLSSKNKATIEEQRKRLKANELLMQDITSVQREIDRFVNSSIEEQLESYTTKLSNDKNKVNTFNTSLRALVGAVADRQKKIANHELILRNLSDNVQLRAKQVQAEGLSKEIEDLRTNIGGFNYRTVLEEKQRLSKRHATLEKDINTLTGEKTGLLASITELEGELNQPENKQAYTEYLNKYYEVVIAKKVIDDMYVYVKGFEQAIIEFHKARMVQINQQIRELWRDIYRGNDIDYVEIKTEYGTGKKASYEYKVVQVKKGIELDMRGRCSAGQKILACLIIRMALAETLSTNCGILALDEPTTNLDKENIQSLCSCLSRIIASRSQDKNFQLIIITHDEEFLTTLTRVQALHYFYRVSRDDDGFSVIKKEYAQGM